MEGLGSFLLFAVLFFLMMRYGCGAHMMHGHGGHGSLTSWWGKKTYRPSMRHGGRRGSGLRQNVSRDALPFLFKELPR